MLGMASDLWIICMQPVQPPLPFCSTRMRTGYNNVSESQAQKLRSWKRLEIRITSSDTQENTAGKVVCIKRTSSMAATRQSSITENQETVDKIVLSAICHSVTICVVKTLGTPS